MINAFHNKQITAHYSPMFSNASFTFLEVSEQFAEHWGCQVGQLSCRDGGWCGIWTPVQSFNSLFMNGLYSCTFERRKILPFVNWLLDLNLTNMYVFVYYCVPLGWHCRGKLNSLCWNLKALVLLSPAVLSIKDARTKILLSKQVFIAVDIQLCDMCR